jgi:hypothetical protein
LLLATGEVVIVDSIASDEPETVEPAPTPVTAPVYGRLAG